MRLKICFRSTLYSLGLEEGLRLVLDVTTMTDHVQRGLEEVNKFCKGWFSAHNAEFLPLELTSDQWVSQSVS